MRDWAALLANTSELHAVAALYIGLTVGGLLTVIWWRLRTTPADDWGAALRTLSHPRSHCPCCGAGIAWHDMIPVLGWVIARGHCRACGATIPARYPLTEAAAAALLGALTAPWWGQVWFWAMLPLTALLLALATARAAGFRPAGGAATAVLLGSVLLAALQHLPHV